MLNQFNLDEMRVSMLHDVDVTWSPPQFKLVLLGMKGVHVDVLKIVRLDLAISVWFKTNLIFVTRSGSA